MYQSPFSSSDSSAVLRAGWRYRKAVLLAVALGVALGLAFGLSRSEATTVTMTVVLRDPGEVDQTLPSKDHAGAYERFVRSQALFARSDEVLGTVAARFETSIDDVRDRVDVAATSAAEVLRFSSRGETEVGARTLLSAHLAEYRSARLAWIATTNEIVREVIDESLDGANQATVGVIGVENEIATRIYDDGVSFLGEEKVSRSSDLIRVGVPVALGAIVALMAALSVAAMVGERRPLVLGSHILVDRFDVPVRAVIPARSADRPLAYRHLGADLQRSILQRAEEHTGAALMLMVVGVDIQGEALRSVFVEAIRNIAQSGHRVAIVDADVNNEPESRFTEGGPVETFSPAVAVETELLKVGGGGQVVGIRPAYGRRALPDYAGDGGFQRYLAGIRGRFDLVVVECPPLGVSPSARRMARFCDEAIVVVANGSRLDGVDDTVRTIGQAGTYVSGYIFSDEPIDANRRSKV